MQQQAPAPHLPMPSCPLCHTEALTTSTSAVKSGATWRCIGCGQQWSEGRLATVAAYARHCEP